MLIQFIISNYKSIREPQKLNMVPGSFKIHPTHIYKEKDSIDVLRATAIYGANGAGKSNLVRGLDFLQRFVTEGTRDIDEEIGIQKFKLNSVYEDKPTTFQVDFKQNNQAYSYYIEINHDVIIEESLIKVIPKKRNATIFERKSTKNSNTLNFGSELMSNKKDELKREIYEEELRYNQPFLLEGRNKRIEEISLPFQWFDKTLRIVYPQSEFGGLISSMANDEKFRKKVNQLVKFSDTGIKELKLVKVDVDSLFSIDEADHKKKVLSKVSKTMNSKVIGRDGSFYDIYLNEESNEIEAAKLIASRIGKTGEEVNFELLEESSGTQRFIDILPALVQTIYEGKVYVIDEINRSIHPILIHEILSEYLDSDNNLSKGQMIFTSHESSLLNLELFRQDEIWFVEKDKDGSSNLYSLAEFKPRYDLDIRKGYLQGKFGAIPFLFDHEKINW